jgi:AmmeMemoRadiSam system protein A
VVRQGREIALDASEHFLGSDEEGLLLRIAHDSLVEAVTNAKLPELSPYPLTESLKEKHGAFVTLRSHGKLRGCVGYISNCEPLALVVRDNAYNAALRDTRFTPVRPSELSSIVVEISALTTGDSPETPFRRVHSPSEIKIGRDGVYVERPPLRGGLLLPQVAAEEGWTAEEFLTMTCRKAGYPSSAWRDADTRLYRFSAQVFSDEDYV